MGQINSRHRNIESLPQTLSSTVVPQSETVVDNEPRATQAHIDDEVATSTLFTPKSSRRASVGRSIRNLVSTRSSSIARDRVDSIVSQADSRSSRRGWRTSRRWSKAPEELNSPTERSQEVVASVPENPSEGFEGVALAAPSNAKGKEKEDMDQKPAEFDTSTVDSPPTPFSVPGPSSPAAEAALDPKGLGEGTSTNIGTWMNDQGSEAQTSSLPPNIGSNGDEAVMFPSALADETVGEHEPETSTSPPPSDSQPSTPQGRQFPPPGTLVVVQGVVHTTDVSRPSRPSTRPLSVPAPWNTPRRASSTPRSHAHMNETSAATGARNRLSALIPRPASIRSRPNSTVEDNNASPSSALAVENESDSESPSVISDTFGSGDLTPASNETDISMASETDARPPALSPSSIDVLGTLLSVAAAATAASLLTGSSDPIFTSGLNPATLNGNIPAPSRPTSYQNRPTSPTPIAGLGGLGSFSSSLGLASPPAPASPHGHGNSRERMRHAWTSFRERLGRRMSNNTASGNIQPEVQGRTRPDGSPMSTRDLMLAEMARAFNLGLGLNSGSDADSAPQTAGESSGENEEASDPPAPTSDPQGHPDPSLPTEDSFDQFLVDLQADLRVALSLQGSPATQPPSYTPSAEGPSAPPDDHSATPLHLPPVITDQGIADNAEHSEVEPESAVEEDSSANPDGTPEMPHLRQILPGINTRMRSRTERRPGGGINWWRSYRFPPVTAPNVHGLPNTLNNPNVASSPLTSTLPSDLFSQPSTSASSSIPPPSSTTTSQDPTTPSAAPAAAENRSNIIIPVIVVGLQSVNMDRRRDRALSLGDDDDALAAEHNDPDSPEMADELNFDGLPADGERSGAPRGRAWHSRAADAFRNLRPGRRASQIPHEGPGSRTFLIYVIGGYYPPDHSLITGVNALDSFEALWELAELLGQVKPQTVSKEEIDNSGLEIVKPTVLEQYEKEGKVASNCMERCLICLDDYEPEADLRLLKCRHAFHKSCVDQWLQTGKNNCPACRTKGVTTDDGPELATATTSTI